MWEGVPEVGLVSLGVVIEELGERGAVLGRIEDQDQLAKVGRVLNVLLLLVKVGMDLEEGGDQGQGKVGVIGAQVLEGDIDGGNVVIRFTFAIFILSIYKYF